MSEMSPQGSKELTLTSIFYKPLQTHVRFSFECGNIHQSNTSQPISAGTPPIVKAATNSSSWISPFKCFLHWWECESLFLVSVSVSLTERSLHFVYSTLVPFVLLSVSGDLWIITYFIAVGYIVIWFNYFSKRIRYLVSCISRLCCICMHFIKLTLQWSFRIISLCKCFDLKNIHKQC